LSKHKVLYQLCPEIYQVDYSGREVVEIHRRNGSDC
jgi:hypothetical protein